MRARPGGRGMIRLAVAGATGRMGRCVLDCAARDDRFIIAAALALPSAAAAGSTVRVGEADVAVVDSLHDTADVLIDFTDANGTMVWLEVCAAHRVPMIIGATGHSAEQLVRIEDTAKSIPIVRAPNCGVGIQAVLSALRKITQQLGDAYDVEIVETHHRHKVDAPSGTAYVLAGAIADARGVAGAQCNVLGRSCDSGPRVAGQIGIHSVRMGEVVGQHEVHFSGPGETITLRHTAHSRKTFAAGALRAASWVIDRLPGLYAMADVLGESGDNA